MNNLNKYTESILTLSSLFKILDTTTGNEDIYFTRKGILYGTQTKFTETQAFGKILDIEISSLERYLRTPYIAECIIRLDNSITKISNDEVDVYAEENHEYIDELGFETIQATREYYNDLRGEPDDF